MFLFAPSYIPASFLLMWLEIHCLSKRSFAGVGPQVFRKLASSFAGGKAGRIMPSMSAGRDIVVGGVTDPYQG